MVTPPSSPHPPHPPTAATSHSVFTLKRTRKATCLRSLATRPVGVERPRVPASINSDFKIKNMQLFIPLLNPRSHIIFLPYVAHFLSKSSPTKPKILLFFHSLSLQPIEISNNSLKWRNHQKSARVLRVEANGTPRLRKHRFPPPFPLPCCSHQKNNGYGTQTFSPLVPLLILSS